MLDFSSQNGKHIHSNFGFGLKFFYEVKYHAWKVPGELLRPLKVILQVPVAPKPSKIIKISMIFMDFQGNPNETSVKHSLMGFWNANVLTVGTKYLKDYDWCMIDPFFFEKKAGFTWHRS